jgi:hypothetical protein
MEEFIPEVGVAITELNSTRDKREMIKIMASK